MLQIIHFLKVGQAMSLGGNSSKSNPEKKGISFWRVVECPDDTKTLLDRFYTKFRITKKKIRMKNINVSWRKMILKISEKNIFGIFENALPWL